jgi:penicillin-binding protein 2
VAFPEQFPPEFKQVAKYNEEVKIPIDEKNWTTLTDAMALVVSPMGTAGRAAVPGVDIAGKTGSAQTVSNDLKKKMGASEKSLYKDNGWFVGVTPRRNPELVVACLFEGGEHGALAAQVATKVIKAYVEKQRNRQTQVARATQSAPKQAEVAAVWHEGDAAAGDNKVQGGHYTVPLDSKTKTKPVAAAPGVAEGEQSLPASTLEATESHTEMASPEVAVPVPAQPGQSDLLQAPASEQSPTKQVPKKPPEKPSTPVTDPVRRSDQ